MKLLYVGPLLLAALMLAVPAKAETVMKTPVQTPKQVCYRVLKVTNKNADPVQQDIAKHVMNVPADELVPTTFQPVHAMAPLPKPCTTAG
jgi:translation elongation factor EF-G